MTGIGSFGNVLPVSKTPTEEHIMIHTTTAVTQYRLGDQTFDAFGLTSSYAGAKFDARINHVEISRGPEATRVTITGYKLRKDGSRSQNPFTESFSLAYDSVAWGKIWDQSPFEFRMGLTNEDRESVTP